MAASRELEAQFAASLELSLGVPAEEWRSIYEDASRKSWKRYQMLDGSPPPCWRPSGRAPRLRSNHRRRGSRRCTSRTASRDGPDEPGEPSDPDLDKTGGSPPTAVIAGGGW
jgi:hypothetical protein